MNLMIWKCHLYQAICSPEFFDDVQLGQIPSGPRDGPPKKSGLREKGSCGKKFPESTFHLFPFLAESDN
jgi:hypothetical protein